MNKLFDLDHPFFRPLWRRVAVTALCLGWGAFEFVSGSPFWGTLFGGLGLYCVWGFLLNYQPDGGTDNEN
ncbi:DUF3329 domain-containing protein [Chelativorans sp. M5D2P16]|uniref:DUF3329 domain-containing protein n=1 Tax=Chelativorans sp. M5D2P16 TaxID=3095678 RepID=UPI002ACA0663|nr:DUF3329 domain-containing protein [Chelativorans sp. M5D2P16]MDZ5700012.1 DUF3329 domain-containing protein [Chelativorans sp. M5D2P16]